MKKIIYSLLAVAALTLSSCEDFTDLQPKGKNLLTTTDQLEMLLNAEVSSCSSDMRQMAGDMIYTYSNIATTISQPVKTRGVIIWTYDEASMDKMAELTSSDQDYSTFYGYIGTISNPILTKIDEASGSEAAKKQLNLDIEKKKLVLPNPIRNLGVTNVPVKLHPKVTGSLKVWVKEEA